MEQEEIHNRDSIFFEASLIEAISDLKNEVAFTETIQNHCQDLYEILLCPNNNF